MSVGDDEAHLRLTEHLGELHYGEKSGGDHIRQDIARSHRWQLIRVSHHNKSAGQRQCIHKGGKHNGVHHGELVHDDGVRLNGVSHVTCKRHALPSGALGLQQAVDSLGLPSADFRHSLGGPARGSREHHVESPLLKEFQDAVHRGGFSGARSASENEDAPLQRRDNGLALLLLIVQTMTLMRRAVCSSAS